MTVLTRPSSAAAVVPERAVERAAYCLGELVGALSRWAGLGGGSVLPGRVVLRLVPGALGRLSAARQVLLVTGTNGKTTTTRLLAAALSAGGGVVSNEAGANQASGLVTALVHGRRRRGPAVLEVDEMSLPAAAPQLVPAVLVLLNLSRDQLDRSGEVASHVVRWRRMLAGLPTTVVVANADDPLVAAAVLGARPTSQRVVWVSVGQPWRADSGVCPRCGAPWSAGPRSWGCAACGFARPDPGWSVVGDAIVASDGEAASAGLRLPGAVNIGNAAFAAAAAAQLGVPLRAALARMREVSEVAGRYLQVDWAGVRVRLMLAKNPAGWVEALNLLGAGPAILAVNARTADGADPSWLWDVPFELLRGRRVLVTGDRAADLSVRLLYAGVPHETVRSALDAARTLGPCCDVLANYTAFLDVRNRLVRQVGRS
jgi:UDP-N-acetylmuramyl tripeptide synthase